MKSSFMKPNEDLPLKISAFFSFPRVTVGTFIFICVGVTPKESTHETEASMRAEGNVKCLTTKSPDSLLLFLQCVCRAANSELNSQWLSQKAGITEQLPR